MMATTMGISIKVEPAFKRLVRCMSCLCLWAAAIDILANPV